MNDFKLKTIFTDRANYKIILPITSFLRQTETKCLMLVTHLGSSEHLVLGDIFLQSFEAHFDQSRDQNRLFLTLQENLVPGTELVHIGKEMPVSEEAAIGVGVWLFIAIMAFALTYCAIKVNKRTV
jgi:hypothetical protein